MKVRQTLYMEEELMKRVKHQSIDENKSISQWIKEAIQYKMWHTKKVEKNEKNS